MSNNFTLLKEAEASRFKIFFLIGGFLIIFFPTVILGIDSFFYRDFGALAYPIIYFWKSSILNGELPLWNPLSHCGVPFIAQWGTMSLYPLSLIYLILPLPLGLNLFSFLHLIIGGAGMYLLAKKWTEREYAALIAGAGYVFNGATLSCLMWPNYIASLCWLPWIIYSAEKAFLQNKKYIYYSIIFSLLQYLAGVPEIVLITQFILLSVFISVSPVSLKIIVKYLVILISPIILCAAQLLPFIYLYFNSHRQLAIDVNKWAMPGWGWANFVVPLFHYYETYQHTFIQNGQAFLTSYYFPLIFISLSIIAIFNLRNKRIAMLMFLTLLSLILALGENSFLFSFLHNYLPLSIKIRYPIKFILITIFTIPLLSAYGLIGLERNKYPLISSALFIILTGGLILYFNYNYQFEYDQFDLTFKNSTIRFIILIISTAILVLVYKNYTRKYLFYILLMIIAFDSEKFIKNFHPIISSDHFASKLWEDANKYKRFDIAYGRVFISREAEEKLLRSTVSDWSANFIGKRLALWSNLNLLEEMPKVNGAFTLQIKYQKEIEKELYNSDVNNISNMLKYLSVKYITRKGSVIEWTNYDNSMPLITAGQSVVIMNDELIKQMLFSDNYEPDSVLFISESETNKMLNINILTNTSVKIYNTNIENHIITLEYESSAPSILSISQSYYPLWKAYIDGTSTPILRANYAFQAICIPQGRHYLIIKYEDIYFNFGLIISIAGLILLVILNRTIRSNKD
ncbi:MAG: YfhO family protein [Verrucomicrobiia bacterium]